MEEKSFDEVLKTCNSNEILTVSKNPMFIRYLLQGKPAILEFIVKNFDRIIEIVFYERHKDIKEIHGLLAILECKEFAVKKELINSTRFVEYILDFPRIIKLSRFPTFGLFFNLLPYMILDTNERILPFFANADFFKGIVLNCDLEEAFSFILSTLTTRFASFGAFYEHIRFPGILLANVNGNTELNMNAIKLFEITVSRYPAMCADILLETNIIPQIINNAFTIRCSQLIDFLNFLYIKSFSFKTESKWFDVEDIIDDKIPNICDYLLETVVFDKISKSSAEIIVTYLHERHQQFPKVTSVIKKFTNEMFDFPTNSFLHLTVYKLLKEINVQPVRFKEVITETKLCEKILNAYKERENNKTSCYWGVLRKVSEMIVEPVNVSLTEWQSIVVGSNLRNEKIIATITKPRIAANSLDEEIANKNKYDFKIRLPSVSDLATIIIFVFALILYFINNSDT